jgi:hypothetical protein
MKSTTRVASTSRFIAPLFCFAVLLAAPAWAVPVFVPDNGGGTANVPILADYVGQTPMQIIAGLPLGSTIDIDAVLETPVVYIEAAGGSLGGTKSGGGDGGLFTWQMQGTGAFAGYNRTLSFPMPTPLNVLSFPGPNSDIEVHTAPRTPFAPLQSFDTDMFRLFGQRGVPEGDPDFDLLRIVAGTDFGMPSPGHTTLLQSGPNWEVDSFFDIAYRIDFVGNNTGPFAGMSGSTNGFTVRFSLGDPIAVPEPGSLTLAGIGAVALSSLVALRRARRRN